MCSLQHRGCLIQWQDLDRVIGGVEDHRVDHDQPETEFPVFFDTYAFEYEEKLYACEYHCAEYYA